MEKYVNRAATNAGRQLPMVNLIVSVEGDDRFLVEMTSAGPRCPQVALPLNEEGMARFRPRIEAAARAALGLDVSYAGLLAFDVTSLSVEMHALVTAHGSVSASAIRGFAALTLEQLTRRGATAALIHQCEAAAHRASAEQFASTIGERVQQALMKSVQYIEEKYTNQDGLCGWSQYWHEGSVGILSTAQGLLALVHAGARSRFIHTAAATLEQTQNDDGGWAVRHSLIGRPNSVSITESTCYCMWALVEADRTVSGNAISRGAMWLLGTQRPSGGWAASGYSDDTEVIATAFAVRILTGLGPAIVRAVAYLEREFDLLGEEPWPSTVFATSVDPDGKSMLAFQNFALPWVLVALSMAGFDLSDSIMQVSIDSMLQFQYMNGGWWCWQSDRRLGTVWSAHDVVFALRSVMNLGSSNLAPMAMRRHSEATITLMEGMVEQLLRQAMAPRRAKSVLANIIRTALSFTLVLGIAIQISGLLDSAKNVSVVTSAVMLILTAVVGAVIGTASVILIEECRRRRGSTTRRGRQKVP